jgi:CHAT domain-containing protein/Tfp pilus assembly protein PilF
MIFLRIRAPWLALLAAVSLWPAGSWAQEARLKELNAQAAQLARQGKWAEAAPIAEEAAKVAGTAFGADSIQAAVALSNLGLTYSYMGKFAQSEPPLQRALAIIEKSAGPDSPSTASALRNLALTETQLNKLDDAGKLLQRVVAIDEKTAGPDDPKVAAALNDLASVYEKQSNYALDLPVCQRILAIYEKAFPPGGPDRPEVAAALVRLGRVYLHEEKYAQAEPLTRRALGMYEKALGPDSPSIEDVLNDLALADLQLAKYAESEVLYKRALAISEKAHGPDHPDVAQEVNNLADLYVNQGRFPEAETLYDRALAIRIKTLGADDLQVAHTLNNLASLSSDEGKYPQAESLFQRCLAIQEKAHKAEDRDLAATLNDLGSFYVHEGKYAQAEPLLQRALHIDETTLGPDHINNAYVLNNLGSLYQLQGKLVEAVQLFERSLSIREKALGPDHPDVAIVLFNLGKVKADQGKNDEAKALYLRGLAIETKALGPDHPTLAASYQNVAVFLMNENAQVQAEQFYKQALAINVKVLGADHPEVGSNLGGLGWVYTYENKFDQAEPMFQRALAIEQKAYGDGNPTVGTALENLAQMYDYAGKVPQAQSSYQKANENLFRQFQTSFSYMTEKDRLSFLDKVTGNFQTFFSFVHRNQANDPQLIGSMYNLLLWEKGFVAGSVATMRRQVEASGDAEALKLLAQLTEKRTQLAALLNTKPVNPDQWRKQVEQLEAEASDTEKALVARSSAFAQQKQLEQATWQQVRDALKPGEAAVEFARFRYSDYRGKIWTFRTYYSALVITHDTKDHPQYIFLGDDKQIETDALAHFQHALQTRGFAQQAQSATLPGPHAYDLVWKPLDAALAGVTRIDLAADGNLNEVPLGIIPAPDGKLLMEKYDLRLVSSTRDILRHATARTGTTTALLVGDPVFDLTAEQQRSAVAKLALPQQKAPVLTAEIASSGSRDLGNNTKLPPLPGTGLEINSIAGLMQQKGWKTAVYTGDQALKTVVESSGNARVVHLATHGFFLPDQEIAAQHPTGASTEPQPSALEDPMLRSGLYFAAADRTLAGKPSPPGLDNGVLTALEAGNLNLTGTQLVVLSACDTGEGDVKNGEGVFGLRRALQEAGAQSVLMSLWSVPDKETLELMQIFYAKWLNGTEVHQALREAQLEMRDKVKAAHDNKDLPYYWGAFVLVGQ